MLLQTGFMISTVVVSVGGDSPVKIAAFPGIIERCIFVHAFLSGLFYCGQKEVTYTQRK